MVSRRHDMRYLLANAVLMGFHEQQLIKGVIDGRITLEQYAEHTAPQIEAMKELKEEYDRSRKNES